MKTYDRKYEISDHVKIYGDRQFYRIRALRDIPRYAVKAGDLGGYVGTMHNLSHTGDCWIGGDAMVFDQGLVFDHALVSGCSMVHDNALVFGWAHIYEHAYICQYARIYDEASIGGTVRIGGIVEIYGSAHLSGNTQYRDGERVMGYSFGVR